MTSRIIFLLLTLPLVSSCSLDAFAFVQKGARSPDLTRVLQMRDYSISIRGDVISIQVSHQDWITRKPSEPLSQINIHTFGNLTGSGGSPVGLQLDFISNEQVDEVRLDVDGTDILSGRASNSMVSWGLRSKTVTFDISQADYQRIKYGTTLAIISGGALLPIIGRSHRNSNKDKEFTRIREAMVTEQTGSCLSNAYFQLPLNRVGGSLAAPVLPHHRTYGSVYGGS